MKNLFLLPVLFILALFVSCSDDDYCSNLTQDESIISTPLGLFTEQGREVRSYLYNGDGTIARIDFLDSNGDVQRSNVWTIISDNEYLKEAYINGGTDYYITDRYERTSDDHILKTRFNKNSGDIMFVQKQVFGECGDTAIYDVDDSGNETLILSREYSNNCLTEVTTYPNGNTITNEYDGKIWYENSVYSFAIYDDLYVEKGNILSSVSKDAGGNITNQSSYVYEYNSDNLVTKITSTNNAGNVTVINIRY